MRWLTTLTLLLTAPLARADSFAEVVGGIAIPIANDSWTKVVETSPKLSLRAGAIGGGVWFRVGGTELGAEVALPIGYHSKKNQNGISFDYTSYDLDLLFGIRIY